MLASTSFWTVGKRASPRRKRSLPTLRRMSTSSAVGPRESSAMLTSGLLEDALAAPEWMLTRPTQLDQWQDHLPRAFRAIATMVRFSQPGTQKEGGRHVAGREQ